jgi:hypothetical protein
MPKTWKNHLLPFVLLFACFASTACGYPGAGASITQGQHNRQHSPGPLQAYNVPLAFEQNTGQVTTKAKYFSRGPGYLLFLMNAQAVFTFSPVDGTAGNTCMSGPSPQESIALISLRGHAKSNCVAQREDLRLRFLGANPDVQPEGVQSLSSYTNYLIGSDRRNWRTHVPQFGEVWYHNIYPGIDLGYHGNDGALEYDLTVAPGANAAVIAFSIGGMGDRSGVRMNANGNLLIGTSNGEILLQKPRIFLGNGCGTDNWKSDFDRKPGCRPVDGGRFILHQSTGDGVQVNFELPVYDHSQTLVIDPVVSFSTFLGGSVVDSANGMALDSSGNIYLIGQATSPDFPTTSGTYQTPFAGNSDIVITELSADGSHLVYSTYLGGTKSEYAHGIALDSSNNAYVTGETYSSDFPLVNAFQSQNLSGTGFVSKLSSDGTKLIFSTFLGGSLEGSSNAIAVDGIDEPVVAGRTYSTDFPVVNAFQPTHASDNGNEDGFVTKLSADGKSLIFSTYLGGNSYDYVQGLAFDSLGNVYVTGITVSSNFPTTAGSFQPQFVSNPWGSSFVSKFGPSGQNLLYSTYLSGGQAFGIAVNSLGNAYVTGFAGESGFPVTPGAFQTIQGGGSSTDAFVTELDATGSSLVYSTYLGGNNEDDAGAIALDSSGNAYVTGQTSSSNFPLRSPVQPNYSGVPNVFVSELNNTGSQLMFSTYLGGGAQGFGNQRGNAIAVDKSGDVYVAGFTATPDFPVVRPLQSQLHGLQNAFIAKLLNSAAPEVVVSPSSLSFPTEVVNVASPSQTITVTNSGTSALSVSSVTTDGDFSETNRCTSTIAPNSSCTIQAFFTPSVFGTRTGQVNVFNNATLQPEVVQLSGTGEDFQIAGSPGSQSVSPGQTATYSVTLTPESGFSQVISLSCTGAPAASYCSVMPSSLTLDGTNTSTATVTIATTARSAGALIQPGHLRGKLLGTGDKDLVHAYVRVAFALLVLCCVWRFIPWPGGKELVRTLIVIVLILFLNACGGQSSSSGGGGGGGTPPGSYLIVVTGTSVGNLNHGVEATLTVH